MCKSGPQTLRKPTTTTTTNMPFSWSLSQTTSATSTSTTASTPSPNLTPPNFTDWLHISPPPQSTMPFQDLSSSTRINLGLQEPENCLHYLYNNISDFLGFTKTPPPASAIPVCLSPPANFNPHHRMLSQDSTTTTFNSPGSLALFAPAVEHQSHSPQFLSSSSSTSLFASSTAKFIEDLLQTSVSPFGNYFKGSVASLPSLPMEDISPVVRADTLLAGHTKLSSGPKKLRNRKKRNQASSFVQKLRSLPSPGKKLVSSSSAQDLLEEAVVSQRLLSPCKLVPSTSNNLQKLSVDNRPVLDILTSPLPDVSGSFPVAPLPCATKASAEPDIFSPLTPLTPLSSSPALSRPPQPPLKIVIKLKRKSMDEFPTTPPRRSKRSRRTALVEMQLSPITDRNSSSPLPELSPEFNPTDLQNHRQLVYTNRKLPSTIEISDKYPLFYRRFPVSRHYKIDDSEYGHSTFFS
jgi:hypothetical protein